MKYLDAHSHIQMKEFDKDRDAVISRMRADEVGAVIVGVDYESSKKAVELADKTDFFWATIGMHPHDNLEEVFDIEKYRALAMHHKVVAIGECGLDYSRTNAQEALERQNDIFKQQIRLAMEIGKPLMLHCRDVQGKMSAYDDMLETLDGYPKKNIRGNVHFFAGNDHIAQRFFDLGFSISFTGVITFASQYDEVIKNASLANILSETDCPFVAPVPYRGTRNEPIYVKEVVKRIAEIRGENEAEVATALIKNTKRVFGL